MLLITYFCIRLHDGWPSFMLILLQTRCASRASDPGWRFGARQANSGDPVNCIPKFNSSSHGQTDNTSRGRSGAIVAQARLASQLAFVGTSDNINRSQNENSRGPPLPVTAASFKDAVNMPTNMQGPVSDFISEGLHKAKEFGAFCGCCRG